MFTLRINLKIQKNIHEMWILDSCDDFADSFNVRFEFFFGHQIVFLETQRLRSCAPEKNILHFGSCKIQKERCMKNAFPMLPFSSSPGCGRSVMFGKCHQGQEKFGGGS